MSTVYLTIILTGSLAVHRLRRNHQEIYYFQCVENGETLLAPAPDVDDSDRVIQKPYQKSSLQIENQPRRIWTCFRLGPSVSNDTTTT